MGSRLADGRPTSPAQCKARPACPRCRSTAKDGQSPHRIAENRPRRRAWPSRPAARPGRRRAHHDVIAIAIALLLHLVLRQVSPPAARRTLSEPLLGHDPDVWADPASALLILPVFIALPVVPLDDRIPRTCGAVPGRWRSLADWLGGDRRPAHQPPDVDPRRYRLHVEETRRRASIEHSRSAASVDVLQVLFTLGAALMMFTLR